MEAIIYKSNEEKKFQHESSTIRKKTTEGFKLLRMYPQEQRQKTIGIGGAFTESAAYTFYQMSKKKQELILESYFGKTGNRYNLGRTPIQSSDFGLGNYAYVEDSDDKELKTFSLERDKKYIIPFIKEALHKNAGIELLASPWSPPGFMKTNGKMNGGGSVLELYRQMWADVIVRYVLEYRNLGLPITRLTVQNEPLAVQTWESCIFSADDEREFACEYLRKTLDRNGLSDIKINIWDHNKELIYDRAIQTLSTEQAKKDIAGIAFHWYTGDHFDALRLIREKFQDKELIMTEGCVEYSVLKEKSQIRDAEAYAHDMIGDFNAGVNGYIDWNLLLDDKGGPNHQKNYCAAPVMCNPETDSVDFNLSFYYIGHFSRFVKPGAKSVVVSKWSDCVETAGFVNPDGEKVLVVLNCTDQAQNFEAYDGENIFSLGLDQHSIMTVCW